MSDHGFGLIFIQEVPVTAVIHTNIWADILDPLVQELSESGYDYGV